MKDNSSLFLITCVSPFSWKSVYEFTAVALLRLKNFQSKLQT